MEQSKKSIIYKYPLSAGGATVLEFPASSRFLSVKVQGDEVVAYFLLNAESQEDDSLTTYRFYLIGTGYSFGVEGMTYLDTLLLYDDTFVLHVFSY